ncbi:tetratricopeptide repeat-containing protein [Pleurocapsa sp. CCALA 161]|uniref:tetratricopeptide repeat protein n=1 Tax=Pleurocapsa sp. CCALA 161 TaxID=2107688 RepID=UPI000D081185|nr:tetratricopeptide repeat-containing protein [Pleurocapsa sp. CCALA 161]PSB06538.1 tetratricopeptide repeat-containing protein [Pleurocapsa sp. CCALA 161]
MAKSKNKQETTSRKLSRVVTLVLGLGFAGSTLVIALGSVFSQPNNNVAATDPDAPSMEEQIKLQVTGYEKVLEREPKNVTALEGLAQIYIQTDPQKAIPSLEKLAQYYPEQKQYAGILKLIKQQEAKSSATPKAPANSE